MRFRHKPEYPVSHLSATTQYAAQNRNLPDFNAYVWQEGMPDAHIKNGPIEPGDYVMIAEDGQEWRSEKSFFESQYEPVSE